jgi:hypothetical protein
MRIGGSPSTRLLVVVAASCFTACSGAGNPTAPIPRSAPVPTPTPTPIASLVPAAPATPLVYAYYPDSSVAVYAAPVRGASTEAPLGTISGSQTGFNGSGSPLGIALDASGRIYVTDDATSGFDSVIVFGADPVGTLDEAPLATITGSNTGLSSPYDVAVDGSGKIYVANANGNSVTVYAANPSGTMNEAPWGRLPVTRPGLPIRLVSLLIQVARFTSQIIHTAPRPVASPSTVRIQSGRLTKLHLQQ